MGPEQLAAGNFGLGVAGGVLSLGSNIANSILGQKNADRNFKFQNDVFNYSKQLQREIFAREDNAIRRRSADIAAAGGNPAMAWETGNGAGAGQSIPVQAPQGEHYDFKDIANSSISQIAGGLQQFQQFEMNDAQIKSINAATSKTKAETITEAIRQKQLEMMTAKTEEERDYLRAQIEALNYDLNYSIDHDLRTNDPNSSIYNAGKDIVNNISHLIPDNLDSLDNDSLLSLAADIGLTIIPGFAALKFGKLGATAIKSALQFIKKRKGMGSTADFIVTYKKLTGRHPSVYEINTFKDGLLQRVPFKDNPYPKSYYYRKYGR